MRTIAFVLAAFAVYSVAPTRRVLAGRERRRLEPAGGGATRLDARTIARLRVRWTFRFPRSATDFGAITANPIIAGGTV
jgi:hypothetical protein